MERHCHPVRPAAPRQLFPVRVTPFFMARPTFQWACFRISDCRINNFHSLGLHLALLFPPGSVGVDQSVARVHFRVPNSLAFRSGGTGERTDNYRAMHPIPLLGMAAYHPANNVALFLAFDTISVTTGAHRSIPLWISSFPLPALVAR